MGIVKQKPTDLSHLVDARIGNPDADFTDILSGYDFTTWATYSSGVADNATTFHGNSTNDGVRKDNVLTIGVRYKVHLVGINNGVNFDFGDYTGALPYYTHAATGSFDFYVVFTAIHEGIRVTSDSLSGETCTVSTLEVTEYSGEELVPDPDVGFVANTIAAWSSYTNNILVNDGNAIKQTYVDDTSTRLVLDSFNDTIFNDPSIGDKWEIVLRYKVNIGASVSFRFYNGAAYEDELITATNTEYQTVSHTLTIAGAVDPYLNVYNFGDIGVGNPEIVWIEILSVMKVTGLVAAYNMIPSGDTLVDISGEGNNGDIIGAVSGEEGMVSSGDRIDLPDSTMPASGAFTIAVRWRFTKLSVQNTVYSSGGVTNWLRDTSGAGLLKYRWKSGSFDQIVENGLLPNQWYDFIVAFNGDVANLYLNGVHKTAIVDPDIANAIGSQYIGDGGYTYLGYCEISDFKAFNYAFSEQEAIAYHNSFQQISQRHNFDDLGVGSTI